MRFVQIKPYGAGGGNGDGKLGRMVEPQKIDGLSNVKNIIDGGSAIYALTEGGRVYVWGKNSSKLLEPSQSAGTVFNRPIELKELELKQIIDLDVRNNKAFALDEKGHMYVWGMYLYGYDGYEDSILNSIPGFPQEYEYLTQDVASVIAGSGNYHYFIRKDGTAFSLMEFLFYGFREPYAFIFPTNKEQDNNIFTPVNEFNMITINENTKMGEVNYYNLDGVTNIETIASDAYTMFLYKRDGTLWYWNSDRIKYHDNSSALYSKNDTSERINGHFEKIIFDDIFQIQEPQLNNTKITSMKSGKENVLFLTDDGQVFASYYETYTTEEVEFYNPNTTNPERTIFTNSAYMNLKVLQFKKIDWEDVVSISSDGGYGFSGVDSKGNYLNFHNN